MNAENLKWLIGTAITGAGVWIAYLQYSRSSGTSPVENDSHQQSRPVVRNSGKSKKRFISFGTTRDLEESWEIAESMADGSAADRKRKEIVDIAIARGELDFALRVVGSIADRNLADGCKEQIINAHHGR